MKILAKITFICALSFYKPSMPRNQKTQSCQKLPPESSITNENKTCIEIPVQSNISGKEAVAERWPFWGDRCVNLVFRSATFIYP